MAKQTVTLEPGESQVVAVEVTPTIAKTYQVSVDGLTGSFKATRFPVGNWVSPTSHIDPESAWFFHNRAYDGDITTMAGATQPPENWTPYLEFLINEAFINKIRFHARYNFDILHTADVDVYYDGAWHDVYFGVFTWKTWVESKVFPGGTQLVSKARIRFYFPAFIVEGITVGLEEFQFNKIA